MPRTLLLGLLAAFSLLATPSADGQRVAPGPGATGLGPALNRLPEIEVEPPAGDFPVPGLEHRFRVTVRDPDGDRVSVFLSNPPPGMVFVPLRDVPSPAVAEARWWVYLGGTGTRELVFEAHDDVFPDRRVRARVTLRNDASDAPTAIGDVTGDGGPDLVVQARGADHAGPNSGALYVFAQGGVGDPVATLAAQGWPPPGGLRFPRLEDVDGDGVLDVIGVVPQATVQGIPDSGALHLWRGGSGLTGEPAPRASLTVPGAKPKERLADFVVGDVTGDGRTDLVTGSSSEEVLYVWEDVGNLEGESAPSATLEARGIGTTYPIPSWRLGDVTGDGVEDVLVGGTADMAGEDVTAIHVFAGGAAVTGQVAPVATLLPTFPDPDGGVNVVAILDFDGDGILDVLGREIPYTVGTAEWVGAFQLWYGGAGITGETSPHATLSVPTPLGYEQLGAAGDDIVWARQGWLLGEVTGDGHPDLVALSLRGKILLWTGGARLDGLPGPTAVLGASSQHLSSARVGLAQGQSLLIVDVTGDGTADVVAGDHIATRTGGPARTGAVHVWKGGPGLTGAREADATLMVPGAQPDDYLGWGWEHGQLLHVADVTGDGLQDVIAVAPFADTVGGTDSGAVYLWEGGTGLCGLVWARASMVAPGYPGIEIGSFGTGFTGEGVVLADVTGDGAEDVLARNHSPDVFLWIGGPGLVGTSAPAGTLGTGQPWNPEASGQILQAGDTNGDGVADVHLVDSQVAVAGLGGVWRWNGGGPFANAADDVLRAPDAAPGDVWGWIGGVEEPHGLRFLDVDGNGTTEALVGASLADRGGVSDVGAVQAFGAGTVPVATHAVPGASAGDQLGF